MGHSLRATEWKPAETAGTHSQSALALIGAVNQARIRELEEQLRALKRAA